MEYLRTRYVVRSLHRVVCICVGVGFGVGVGVGVGFGVDERVQ